MIASRRKLLSAGFVLAGAAAIAVVGGQALQSAHDPRPATTLAASQPVSLPNNDPLQQAIARLQGKIRDNPADSVSLAVLGLEYVQQAKISVDPSFYPKAEGVLARSLGLNSTSNFQAMAGQASYRAALHDFTGARSWALRGLKIDPYNVTLYGSLVDAETQLGHFSAAREAAQKMLNLNPGVPALTRGEYVLELEGQVAQARTLLDQAQAAATTPSDIAFVHQTASDLAFSQGNPSLALREADAGITADPSYSALLESRAKAEVALDRKDEALRDYADLVARAPQPQYLVEYGEYLDSLGQSAKAREQYDLFDVEGKLFTANGVTLDTDPTLFYADHGDPTRALQYGKAGLAIRPFIEMQDAYAWALHANARNAEALTWSTKAASLGTRNALFAYHRGIIQKSLGMRQAAAASLQRALSINPYFSPRDVPLARKALADVKSGR